MITDSPKFYTQDLIFHQSRVIKPPTDSFVFDASGDMLLVNDINHKLFGLPLCSNEVNIHGDIPSKIGKLRRAVESLFSDGVQKHFRTPLVIL